MPQMTGNEYKYLTHCLFATNTAFPVPCLWIEAKCRKAINNRHYCHGICYCHVYAISWVQTSYLLHSKHTSQVNFSFSYSTAQKSDHSLIYFRFG